MYDLPGAIQLYPNGGETHIRARTQACDYSHISIMADLFLDIGLRNPNWPATLHLGDLHCFCLLLAIRNNSEIIGLNPGECPPIAAIVRLHPLLFDGLQIEVIHGRAFAACLSLRQTCEK